MGAEQPFELGSPKGTARPSAPYYTIRNPFDNWTSATMEQEAINFAKMAGLERYQDEFVRGGKLNLDPDAYTRTEDSPSLGLRIAASEEEVKALQLERSSKHGFSRFNQSSGLLKLVILCSAAAAVQGWDESAVNGAQVYYSQALQLPPQEGNNFSKYGLVNSAPYLCCTLSCLLTYPLNKYLGRRKTIFLTCLISFAACLGQAFVNTWETLFVARLILGLGIGPKSATVPIYSAECAPANVRGALVMMWQMWTAFGIMLGYAAGVALQHAGGGSNLRVITAQGSQAGSVLEFRQDCSSVGVPPDASPDAHLKLSCSLNWRLMLASPMILPLVVAAYVLLLPESPRWLLDRAHKNQETSSSYYKEAFKALCKLRHTELQAARDLLLIHYELLEYDGIWAQQHPSRKLLTEGRSRRALVASLTVMFLQQFCGVNVLAYYSTTVLLAAGANARDALLGSMGFGIINWLFALPAFYTIDVFGRRGLLLSTFPFMAIFHAVIAVAFLTTDASSDAQKTVVLIGMYLFAIAYSPGEGPVPFTYAAESMPLYNRDIGMGIVTAVTWFFNFVVAITWPTYVQKFTQAGAFFWYAAWCVAGEVLILLLVPETKGLSLEELAEVFQIPTRDHARHGLNQVLAIYRWCIRRDKRLNMPVLQKGRESQGPPAFEPA